MKSLPKGKLSPEILKESVLKYMMKDESVLLSPAIGEDGAVFKTRQNAIVAAADPITGIGEQGERAGRLAVYVNANDIYVHAALPRWFFTTLLFPEDATEKNVEGIMSGINKALTEIGATLIGGHTELTEKVKTPVLSGFMIGEPMTNSNYVCSSGGMKGDRIIMTKGAGIEGTFILATDFKNQLELTPEIMERAMKFEEDISVLPEIQILVEEIGVEKIHAMHDATEGGVLGGVFELGAASGKGFKLWKDKVYVREETKRICEIMGIDPIKLISSGTLLAALSKRDAKKAVRVLREQGVKAAIVAKMTGEKCMYLEEGEEKKEINEAPVDEIWGVEG